jgi:hypothetical protein
MPRDGRDGRLVAIADGARVRLFGRVCWRKEVSIAQTDP